MIEYVSSFNGWLGKTAEDFTYENVFVLASQLAKYYKKNSTTGQKLIVGYDPRVFAKEFAEFLACVMAKNGIKVFLSNKVSPSSALVVASLHKKSMGAVSLTADSFDYRYLGIRAFDNKGYSLSDKEIVIDDSIKATKKDFEHSVKKWITKGYVEPFDPTICYVQHIEQMIDFKNVVATNRILFNPMHGSGTFYFDDILSEKGLRGYTMDSELKMDLKGVDSNSTVHVTQLYDDMVFHGTEFGFMVSPDCSHFHFLIEPHDLKPRETLYLLLESFLSKGKSGKILLCDNQNITLPTFASKAFEAVYVKEEAFQQELKDNAYQIGIDAYGRFYFSSHGAADALLCGYYLIELLNHKDITPKTLHQKLNKVKGVF